LRIYIAVSSQGGRLYIFLNNMGKRIPLTKGKYAIIDDGDYEWINQWKWYAHIPHGKNIYAVRTEKNKCKFMHREILGINDPKVFTDHINRNGLDNRRKNLRTCTIVENNRNHPSRKGSSSKYKGVSWNKKHNKWVAMIEKNRVNYYLGCFCDEKNAAIAYNQKAKELFGDFAWLNKINEGD